MTKQEIYERLQRFAGETKPLGQVKVGYLRMQPNGDQQELEVLYRAIGGTGNICWSCGGSAVQAVTRLSQWFDSYQPEQPEQQVKPKRTRKK